MIAQQVEQAVIPFTGGELPVRLTVWDGSSAGPTDAPEVTVHSADALRRIVWQPAELGAAQAYVTGEVTFDGDLAEALDDIRARLDRRGVRRLDPRALLQALRTAVGLGVVSRPPAPPASQARLPKGLRGRLHAPSRDRWAISHHYDMSNDFYAALLGETMAYSCGYYASPTDTLDQAQLAKLDLIIDKLGLEPGMRLLDIGCGWGSLTVRAAERGITVHGITIAREQREFVQQRIDAAGLGHLATVHLRDYREAPDALRSGSFGDFDAFDAVGSVEMGEHVGQRNYPTYAGVLRDCVREGGRVLVQQMSRSGKKNRGGGPFIETFIAPDMYMRPVGETVAFFEDAGLEVRDVHAMREHYVLTVDEWKRRMDAQRSELTALVGEEVMRVWDLYMVGGSAAFRDGRMGVDQILMVRPGSGGRSDMPLRRTWVA